MTDLTITQEYMICVVNDKGILSNHRQYAAAALIASGLLEMEMENCIDIENNKIAIKSNLPAKLLCLKPLYEEIEQARAIKIEKIIETYMVSLTETKFRKLTSSINNSLVEAGVAKMVKAGILENKEGCVPNQEIRDHIIEEIRAEILGKNTISEKTTVLTILLDKADCLKEYFSKYERKKLKARLGEIRNSDTDTLVKEIIKHVDNLMAAIFISVIVPTIM